jgi:NitT/TauT family transport system permease protein
MMKRLEPVLLPLAVAVALVAGWWLAVRGSGTRIFPSPPQVVRGLGELARRGVLLPYLRDSLVRVAVGYSLAVALGVPFGMWLGASKTAAEIFGPVLQLLRPISPIAWIPVAIVLFGVGNLAPVFLVFLASLFPVVLTAQNGVATIPPMYLRAARNFGLSPVAMAWRVLLPASLPQILSGLRIALGIAWLVVVAAEMIAVDSGLGYLIIDARNAGKRYDLVVAGMLLIGAVGLMLDLLARRVEKLRALRWGFRMEEV